MEKEFCLEEYLSKSGNRNSELLVCNEDGFSAVCKLIKDRFDKEWDEMDDALKTINMQREKNAIIGFEEDTSYYKEKIRVFLSERGLLGCWHPEWYPNLVEGIFAENYGLCGLAPWAYDMSEKYKASSSAKLIGDRLYCMIDGEIKLQPQRIPESRRIQLKRALLLSTPKERSEYGFHEVYLHNGIRITIYSGARTKKGQDIMVFRKYIMKNYTFEAISELGTIPKGACSLFKVMVKIGYNVIFAGQVRSGKTTFLQTWQSYEDKALEGLAIATDPETPWHSIMPDAPIMQLVADGKELEAITKSLLRGDNDYVLLEEMRDASAYNLAIDITSTGTKRSKATIHDNDAMNIPYKMASKINEKYKVNVKETIAQVFKNFDFIFEFSQDSSNKNKKILKSITQLAYDYKKDEVMAAQICRYNFQKTVWEWNDSLFFDKFPNDYSAKADWENMKKELKGLSVTNYLKPEVINPAYYIQKGTT